MIVVSLGAHLGAYSVLQRLRSVILTSLPPLSCQSPLPRSKRQTLLAWAASVPGAESKKAQVYHVYPTRAARTCILWSFSLIGFYIDLILRFSRMTLLLWGSGDALSPFKHLRVLYIVFFKAVASPLEPQGFFLEKTHWYVGTRYRVASLV